MPVHCGGVRISTSLRLGLLFGALYQGGTELSFEMPGISRDMVRGILRAMKAEGVIAPTGKGRGAKWSQVKAEGKT